MNDQFTTEDRNALIAYRIERSEESVNEAAAMIKNKFFNAAINRLYYACYYITIALFLKNEINAQTHSGVKTLLGLHFINTGKLPIHIGKTFATLYEKRQSGDYDDFFYCDAEMADDLFAKANEYIDAIKNLIQQP